MRTVEYSYEIKTCDGDHIIEVTSPLAGFEIGNCIQVANENGGGNIEYSFRIKAIESLLSTFKNRSQIIQRIMVTCEKVPRE